MGVEVGVGNHVGVGVDNNVGVGVDVGVEVGEGVGTSVNVATARSDAGLRDVREAHPARHRSGNRTTNSSQPQRGRSASVGSEKDMVRCATQGGYEDDPGL